MAIPITLVSATEIKDSRGKPTIKVVVEAGGTSADFSVPSGASTGSLEARVLPVSQALENIDRVIAPALLGKDILDQQTVDKILLDLDGTENKSNLGGNAMIGVSIACAKTAAKAKGQEVFEYLRTLAEIKPSRQTPHLYMNLINGGKHAENNLAFQEYLIVPDTLNAEEALGMGMSIQNALKEIILGKLGQDSVVLGDEGGFAPKTSDVREPLRLLREAVKKSGCDGKVRLALDAAATSFYKDGKYEVEKIISKEELFEIYKLLTNEFNLISIEDPFEETDRSSFARLAVENLTLVVGDDLTVTNQRLLEDALQSKSITAMIVKPNQIGTLTETLATMKLARENGLELIVSHRSGETHDDFIADLAYAFGTFGLKAGAPSKEERVVKYKRLITISK